jgi:hypothetical protein
VNVGSSTEVFPMNYTIAFDRNRDGIFDLTDTYTHGVDNTPPRIEIQGLPFGRYRVTVSSAKGCFLQTFEFSILACNAPLNVENAGFRGTPSLNGSYNFTWSHPQTELVAEMVLEGSNGNSWATVSHLRPEGLSGYRYFTQVVPGAARYALYRLRTLYYNGRETLSEVVTTTTGPPPVYGLHPNPATDRVTVTFASSAAGHASYALYSISGARVTGGTTPIQSGRNERSFSLNGVPPGVYLLSIALPEASQPIQFRFVKR